jgi:carbonyl reductase 1
VIDGSSAARASKPGRVALVTGANRGIGLEIARALGRRGLAVVVGARDAGLGGAAAATLSREGIDATAERLDVTDEGSIDAAARAIEARHGGLDVLVNNAGVALDGFNAEVARATLDVNLFGAGHVTDRLLPAMRAGGRVVMLTSGLGDRSVLGPAPRAGLRAVTSRDELAAWAESFVRAVRLGRHAREG